MLILNIVFLFFIDILSFILFNSWWIYSLPLYFLLVNLYSNKRIGYINYLFIICCLFLQDYFIFGRVGLSLIYSLPIIVFAPKLRKIFNFGSFALGGVFLSLLLFFDLFLIKKLILTQNVPMNSTFGYIFINIIIGYLIFLGMLGNRS